MPEEPRIPLRYICVKRRPGTEDPPVVAMPRTKRKPPSMLITIPIVLLTLVVPTILVVREMWRETTWSGFTTFIYISSPVIGLGLAYLLTSRR